MKLSISLAILAVGSVSFAQSVGAAATPSANENYEQALALEKKGDTVAAIEAIKKSIEASPDYLPAHEEYRKLVSKNETGKDWQKAYDEDKKILLAQYSVWLKEFPQSACVEYGMAETFGEDPGAKPYLLKAVELNPKLAPAYEDLSLDAERAGNLPASREYMKKASEAAPDDPSYSFYYAFSLQQVDNERFMQLALDVAKRFPTSERGAQALYWLGEDSTSDSDKIKYWEQDRHDFPPTKFNWSAGAMDGLFDVYARTSPDKAVALATEMKANAKDDESKTWANNLTFAQNLVQVNQLLDQKEYAQAKQLLDSTKISRYSSDAEDFALLKAKADSASGDTKTGYDLLLTRFAKAPEDAVHTALVGYGANMGKTESQVDSDVWALRDQAAKPAPAFDLDMYLKPGKRSLRDYHGKVVLLTFWFPGCGPCRGEFPHFENVLKKFNGQPVDYVGVNVVLTQDDYVKSFIKGTRYTFTPLRSKNTETDYKVRGEPTNFLIDQNGRIVYTDFRASDPKSERSLQLMIQSLLDHKVGS
ncbi:MAG TPA: redoxin family protein [Fimbriimonadaceae bacterium]|jgi:thiol-disulfide isomerase/thioredoxin